MEAFSDNLTCIRDQNKRLWISNLDEITQADSLGTVERSQDDRFVLTGISTRLFNIGSSSGGTDIIAMISLRFSS